MVDVEIPLTGLTIADFSGLSPDPLATAVFAQAEGATRTGEGVRNTDSARRSANWCPSDLTEC